MKSEIKIIADNKKAFFDYDILKNYDAGIVLFGFEVKSVKLKRINLKGSFVVFKGSELYLLNADIPPYQPKNTPTDYDSKRSRKLLLHKSEIKELIGKSHEKGLTMVPLKVYTIRGKIKIEFGLARGKRKYEKREKIKKREAGREIERKMKSL